MVVILPRVILGHLTSLRTTKCQALYIFQKSNVLSTIKVGNTFFLSLENVYLYILCVCVCVLKMNSPVLLMLRGGNGGDLARIPSGGRGHCDW